MSSVSSKNRLQMTQYELAKEISLRTNYPVQQIEKIIKEYLEVCGECVQAGIEVPMFPLGRLGYSVRKPMKEKSYHAFYGPNAGKIVTEENVPGYWRPRFTFTNAFRNKMKTVSYIPYVEEEENDGQCD